jgi:hypothetical protein
VAGTPGTVHSAPPARRPWRRPCTSRSRPLVNTGTSATYYKLHCICSVLVAFHRTRYVHMLCAHLFPASERRVGVSNGSVRTKLSVSSSVQWHGLLSWWKPCTLSSRVDDDGDVLSVKILPEDECCSSIHQYRRPRHAHSLWRRRRSMPAE